MLALWNLAKWNEVPMALKRQDFKSEKSKA